MSVNLVVNRRSVLLGTTARPVSLTLSGARGPRGLAGVGNVTASDWWATFIQTGDSLQALMARLGAATVVPFEVFLEAAGLTVASANHQAAHDLAEAAMEAALLDGDGLIVQMPPGDFYAQRIRFPSRCGYFGIPGQTTLWQLPPTDPATPDTHVKLTDPYGVGWVFYGLDLRGQWTFARAGYTGTGGDAPQESDPFLFQYPATITNYADPDEGCQVGQRAIEIHNALSGVDDAQYIDNNRGGSQIPLGLLGHIKIYGYGGDGISLKGAGGQMVGHIRVQEVGGRCLAVNGYDSNFCELDLGGCGLENVVLGPNGSALRMIPFKNWYGGRRMIAGHTASLRLDRSGMVYVVGHIQDPTGTFLDVDSTHGCIFSLTCDWQGSIPSMTADTPAIIMRGALIGNQINLAVILNNYYSSHPNVTKLIKIIPNGAARPVRNQFMITHQGYPDDPFIWNPAWIDGNLDDNLVMINDQFRQPGQWVPPTDGRMIFGLRRAGGLGFIVGDIGSSQSGQVIAVCHASNEWVYYSDATSSYTNQLKAFATKIEAYLPLRFPNYTVSTVPSPSAMGMGAAICVTNESGGATLAMSDTAHWLRLADRAIIS